MSWVTAVFVYLLIWWLVLFTQLSAGAGRSGEQEVNEYGAPINPMVLRKLIRTTVISALVLLVIWLITLTGWFSMFEILTGEQL